MIVNFYKSSIKDHKYTLLTSKNMDFIPQKGVYITFYGQRFIINEVNLDLDKYEYNLYVIRA